MNRPPLRTNGIYAMYSALLSVIVRVSRPGLLMPDRDVESRCAMLSCDEPFSLRRHGLAARAGLPPPAACSTRWPGVPAAHARHPASVAIGLYLCPNRHLATGHQRALPAHGL